MFGQWCQSHHRGCLLVVIFEASLESEYALASELFCSMFARDVNGVLALDGYFYRRTRNCFLQDPGERTTSTDRSAFFGIRRTRSRGSCTRLYIVESQVGSATMTHSQSTTMSQTVSS